MNIYCIENKIDGKKYVGKTINSIEKRFKAHKKLINKGNNQKKNHLHQAMLKYGVENFHIYQLDIADTEEELLQKEKNWIRNLNTKIEGYNETDGGEGISGFTYSEEYKLKISKRQTEYFASWTNDQRQEHSRKTSNYWSSLNEEEKFKRKQLCSESQIKRFKEKPESFARGFTYTHTKEAKLAIGLAHAGKIVSEDTINKFKVSRIGKGMGNRNAMADPEKRAKLSHSCKGRKKIHREDGTWFWGKISDSFYNGVE